jgi:thiol-disulfide isomerase/thioredoxin
MKRFAVLLSGRKASFAMAAALALVASKPASALAELQRAPAWELQDVSGKTVKLSDFKGQVIVLDFWATWCGPCREEIPGFMALQKKYAGKGLVIIGVSMDEEGWAVVTPFIGKMGITYPMVLGTPEVAAKYGDVEALPTTFIINRAGRIAAAHEGRTDEATLESEIKPLL